VTPSWPSWALRQSFRAPSRWPWSTWAALSSKIGDKEVEFGRVYVKGGYEFYAVLRLSLAEEAVRFVASLRAVRVDAKIVSNAAKLDGDSLFGLLVAAGAVSPSLTLFYRSDEDDFRVYACVEEGRMRFFFVVRQEGVGRRWEAEPKKC